MKAASRDGKNALIKTETEETATKLRQMLTLRHYTPNDRSRIHRLSFPFAHKPNYWKWLHPNSTRFILLRICCTTSCATSRYNRLWPSVIAAPNYVTCQNCWVTFGTPETSFNEYLNYLERIQNTVRCEWLLFPCDDVTLQPALKFFLLHVSRKQIGLL